MSTFNLRTLLLELEESKIDSFRVLDSIKSIHDVLLSSPDGAALADEYRKISVPMIYSSWESHFTSSIAICFNGLKSIEKTACDHSPEIRAVWLQQASFYSSYIDMIKNIYDIDAHKTLNEKMANMKKKVKKGYYKLTTDVLGNIDNFNSMRLDSGVNPDDLVMTFSNVNKVVTELNMDVIGLDHSNLDLTRLDSLVGLRNEFGHGQFSSRVGSRQFNDWMDYSRNLIIALTIEVESWLQVLATDLEARHKTLWKCENLIEANNVTFFTAVH